MSQQQRTDGTPPRTPGTLADRINRLFEVHRPPDSPEREYRNREVVEACRAEGREMSESHLSELRRGIKSNPTMRVLETIAWFFHVRTAYFTDPQTAADVESELAVRQAENEARRRANLEANDDRAEAARQLQQAIRSSGVTKTAHRAASAGMNAREQAAMMRALTKLILDESDDEDSD
jgi:hypothetical protein